MCVCVCVCVCVWARVRACVACVFVFPYGALCKCLGGIVLSMCMECRIWVDTCRVSAQGVDERMINVHYYYYFCLSPTEKLSVS